MKMIKWDFIINLFPPPAGQSLHIAPPTVAHPTLTQNPDPVLDLHAPIRALYQDLALDHVPALVHDLVLVPTLHTPEEAEVAAAVIVLDPAHLHTIVLDHALLPIEGGMEEDWVEASIDLARGHQSIEPTVRARNCLQHLR